MANQSACQSPASGFIGQNGLQNYKPSNWLAEQNIDSQLGIKKLVQTTNNKSNSSTNANGTPDQLVATRQLAQNKQARQQLERWSTNNGSVIYAKPSSDVSSGRANLAHVRRPESLVATVGAGQQNIPMDYETSQQVDARTHELTAEGQFGAHKSRQTKTTLAGARSSSAGGGGVLLQYMTLGRNNNKNKIIKQQQNDLNVSSTNHGEQTLISNLNIRQQQQQQQQSRPNDDNQRDEINNTSNNCNHPPEAAGDKQQQEQQQQQQQQQWDEDQAKWSNRTVVASDLLF